MDELRAVDALGSGWLAGILILTVGMLAWVQMVSPRQWVVLSKSFGAFRLGRHRLREELDMRDRTLTGLAVMSTVVIALFGYQIFLYNDWIQHGIMGFLQILLVVTLVILAQLALLQTIRLLPALDGGLEEYLYTVIVFHVVLGLLLLPVVTLMSFPGKVLWREWIWLVGLAIVGATILFRWVRAVVVGMGNGTPLRYIFLYLCTLEILPAALALEQARHFVPPMHHP